MNVIRMSILIVSKELKQMLKRINKTTGLSYDTIIAVMIKFIKTEGKKDGS